MGEQPQGYVPYGKAGKGTYGSTLGLPARSSIAQVQDKMITLAQKIPFGENETVFNIGDYGAADGMPSIELIGELISSLKARLHSKVQFQIIYEDKPTNDFSSLFKYLHGMLPGPKSYLREYENVFAFASGTDFHKQCVPANSMHFILCSVAVQWLTKSIVPYQNSIYIYPNSSEDERAALKKQSKSDWENFLMLRNKELRHGGILYVICIVRCLDENEKITKISNKTFHEILLRTWMIFRDAGKITGEEFVDTNLAQCPYTLEELAAPFKDKESTVFKTDLEMVSTEMKISPCTIYESWNLKKEKEGLDDREGFAKDYLAAHWNWANSTFSSGLSRERSEGERKQIIEEFYEAVETEIKNTNPEIFKDDAMFSYTVIKKK